MSCCYRLAPLVLSLILSLPAPVFSQSQNNPFESYSFLSWSFEEQSPSRRFSEVHFDERTIHCIGENTCAVAEVPGKTGKAISFDNKINVVHLPKGALNEAGPFTIALWIRPSTVLAPMQRILMSDEHYNKDGFRLGLVQRSDGTHLDFWSTQSGGSLMLDSKSTISANSWYHVAISYSGRDAVLYINGAASTSATGKIIANNQDILLGYAINTDNIEGFLGQVDELAIFPVALNAAEVTSVYQQYQNGKAAFSDLGRAPILNNCATQNLLTGEPWSYKLLANDADFDLSRVEIINAPAGMKIEKESGKVWWTPSYSSSGDFSPSFKIVDRAGHSAQLDCLLKVAAVKQPAVNELFRLPYPGSHDVNQRQDILTFDSNAKYGLAHEGERFSILSSSGSAIRVFTTHGETVYKGAATELPLLPVGHYFVESVDDQTQFFVMPGNYNGSSLFGTGTDNPEDVVSIEKNRLLKPTWRRACTGVAWSDIEKTAGVYDWSFPDAVFAQSKSVSPKLMTCLLDSPPSWIYSQGIDNFVLRFGQFVKLFAVRYRGKVDALEPWNEPNIFKIKEFFPTREPSTYETATIIGRIIAETRRVIQANTPGAYAIYGPTFESPVVPFHAGFPQIFSAQNVAANLDGLDWHDYFFARLPGDVGTHDSGRTIDRIGELKQQLSNSRYVISEFGLFGQSALGFTLDPNAPSGWAASGQTWYTGMQRTEKAALMHIANGAEFIAPHVITLYGNWEIFGWEQSQVRNSGRGVKPQTSAFLMLMHLLDQARYIGMQEISNLGFVMSWQLKDGTSLSVAWSREGQTIKLQPDSQLQARDIYGWPRDASILSAEPSFFFSKTLDVIQLPYRILTAARDGAIQNSFEICDGANLGGQSCNTLGYSSGNLTCTVSGKLDTSACKGQLPLANLKAHFAFDERDGLVAHDSMHQLSAQLVLFNSNGSSGWSDSPEGRALRFDGINDYVILDNSNGEYLSNAEGAPFTISAWLKPEQLATNNFRTLITNEKYGESGFRSGLFYGSSAAFWTFESGGNAFAVSSQKIVSGKWAHVAITYDGHNLSLYVNGALNTIEREAQHRSNQRSILLGGPIAGADNYSGLMRDVMFFDRALADDEILRLRNFCTTQPCPATQFLPPAAPGAMKIH